MALFSKKNKESLVTPLLKENPVTVQVLGICSALAVTSKLMKCSIIIIINCI